METGYLRKMRTLLTEPAVAYALCFNAGEYPLNPLINRCITLTFSGRIACCYCQRPLKKTFSQGYCFPCATRLARCDLCMVRPERCHFHRGTCREPEWGQQHCFQPHVVYMAKTVGLKVGITRQSQIPTRWIDQGAVAALPLFQVSSRRMAGKIEVLLAQFIADKTPWRALLKGECTAEDLLMRANALVARVKAAIFDMAAEQGDAGPSPASVQALPLSACKVVHIHYPVQTWPTRIVALNPNKTPRMAGRLMGIKGQYLLLDTGVINIRKYTGHEVSITVQDRC